MTKKPAAFRPPDEAAAEAVLSGFGGSPLKSVFSERGALENVSLLRRYDPPGAG